MLPSLPPVITTERPGGSKQFFLRKCAMRAEIELERRHRILLVSQSNL